MLCGWSERAAASLSSCMPASSPSCGSCVGHVSDRPRLCDAGDSPEPSALPCWSCAFAANCGERGDSTIALGGTAVQLVACGHVSDRTRLDALPRRLGSGLGSTA